MDWTPLLAALRELYETIRKTGKPAPAQLLNAIGVICVTIAALLRPSEPQPPEPVFGSYGNGDEDGDEVVRLCVSMATDLTGRNHVMAAHGAPRHIALRLLLDAIMEYLQAQGWDSISDLLDKLIR